MLRVIQNRSADGAKSYYSQADYLSESQELIGRWGGKAARKLGLSGTVDKQSFDRLCDNLHPQSGERLTLRNRSNRSIGYDFNFHAPKGVTLALMLGGDERILDAFRESVDQTMQDIEKDAKTRIRKRYQYDERETGNMIWGEFIHSTSRPAKGESEPSPHLHAHCFTFNCTFDDKEQAWKAIQFRDLKRDAGYYEACFHSRLSLKMRKLGYEIERHGRDWDIEGFDKSTLDKFSARTKEIEELATELGIDDDHAKDQLGAKSRAKKDKLLSASQLNQRWLDRLSADEKQKLNDVGQPSNPFEYDTLKAREAMTFAREHAFERDSVVATRTLLTHALRKGLGGADIQDVHEQLDRQNIITRSMFGRQWATTPEVLAEEQAMLSIAQQGKDRCSPLNAGWSIMRQWLNDDQQAAVNHILTSPDQLIMIKGGAGTGKTSLSREAVDAIEAAGKKVFMFAPSAEASRGVLTAEGFEATTVAELLLNKELQDKTAGNVIWIDEAGLLGTRTLKRVMDLAVQNESRIVLMGDYHQHGAVERGAAMRLLVDEGGIQPAEVGRIQRQSGEYREAVAKMAQGFIELGLNKLEELNWIHEIDDPAERYQTMAKRFADGTENDESMLAIAPTHREAKLLSSEIRGELINRGLITKGERTFKRLIRVQLTEAEKRDPKNMLEGDTFVFHKQMGSYKSGDRVSVAEGTGIDLARQADKFELYRTEPLNLAVGDWVRITRNGKSKDGQHRLNNGSIYRIKQFNNSGDIVLNNGWVMDNDYAFIDHGYVSTSHAAQGKTVDHVLIAESSMSIPAASAEQIYVSVSRGRQKAEIFTDDKELMFDAVVKCNASMAATELLNEAMERRTNAYRQRRRAVQPVRQLQKDYEVMYERV
jgi:conjugative relaxase-like TrwC/TraI family protein